MTGNVFNRNYGTSKPSTLAMSHLGNEPLQNRVIPWKFSGSSNYNDDERDFDTEKILYDAEDNCHHLTEAVSRFTV